MASSAVIRKLVRVGSSMVRIKTTSVSQAVSNEGEEKGE
jgi:hypothetical protein